MRWQLLASLTNGWLWLLAVLTGVVLVIASAPVWFAVLSAAVVLLGGAGVQAAVDWRAEKRRRLGGRPESPELERTPPVADPEARAILARASAAAQRARRIREEDPEAPTDIVANAEVATEGAVEALGDLGRQVDRVNRAMSAADPRRVADELARVEHNLANDTAAGPELTEQRQGMAESLRSQLEVYRRLSEQRTLVLTRMRAAAIGLEGLAVRLGEIGALYSAQEDYSTADADLAGVATEMDDLRLGLVEAGRAVRRSLEEM